MNKINIKGSLTLKEFLKNKNNLIMIKKLI